MLSLPAMPRSSLALALLAAGCAAQPPQGRLAPPPEPVVVVVPIAAEPPAAAPVPASPPAAPASPPAAPASSLEPIPCQPHFLYYRGDIRPRKPAFDAAVRAFDSATTAYEQRRYLRAAQGFMEAAASFLTADSVSNRRWAYGNAASSWEMSGNLEAARTALHDAAARDPELGAELERLAARLRAVCKRSP